MSSCSHLRRVAVRLCWLLVVYVAAVAATPPVMAADAVGGHAAKVRALAGATPAPVSSSASVTADDLSWPTATGAFRLAQPPARVVVRRAGAAPSLDSRSRFTSGERGPPPSLP